MDEHLNQTFKLIISTFVTAMNRELCIFNGDGDAGVKSSLSAGTLTASWELQRHTAGSSGREDPAVL